MKITELRFFITLKNISEIIFIKKKLFNLEKPQGTKHIFLSELLNIGNAKSKLHC